MASDVAVSSDVGAVTLRQKLKQLPRRESVAALGCHESWISKLVNLRCKPGREMLDRAKELWPEIDVQASEEEYMSPLELCSRRGRELARLVLALPGPDEPIVSLGSGYLERLRRTALAVLEAGRG